MNDEPRRQQFGAADPAGRDFIVLEDLRSWIEGVPRHTESAVLDFGCGDSPYRDLFAETTYHRADLHGGSALDFEIGADESINAESGAYQTVLSTQVLEHVFAHLDYLRECFRLLAPGGCLIVTTHGLFEEHGHPHDFRRWTLVALARELESIGFVVERADKLTVGPRALMYLFGSQIWKANFSRKTFLGFLLFHVRAFILRDPARWNHFVNRQFFRWRHLSGLAADESLYVGIAIQARKPA